MVDSNEDDDELYEDAKQAVMRQKRLQLLTCSVSFELDTHEQPMIDILEERELSSCWGAKSREILEGGDGTVVATIMKRILTMSPIISRSFTFRTALIYAVVGLCVSVFVAYVLFQARFMLAGQWSSSHTKTLQHKHKNCDSRGYRFKYRSHDTQWRQIYTIPMAISRSIGAWKRVYYSDITSWNRYVVRQILQKSLYLLISINNHVWHIKKQLKK